MRGRLAIACKSIRLVDFEPERPEQPEYHALAIPQHIVIAYPNNTEPRHILEEALTVVVTHAPVGMAFAVALDHQGARSAIEVDNVRADPVLAPKLEPGETPVSQ